MAKKKHPNYGCFLNGAKRDRTDDLLTASQALSQLSYSPIRCVDEVCCQTLSTAAAYTEHDELVQAFFKKKSLFGS